MHLMQLASAADLEYLPTSINSFAESDLKLAARRKVIGKS